MELFYVMALMVGFVVVPALTAWTFDFFAREQREIDKLDEMREFKEKYGYYPDVTIGGGMSFENFRGKDSEK